jgi:hypothetical protein
MMDGFSFITLYRGPSVLIVDKNLLFGKEYREDGPCESTQIQPHDVVRVTDWLKLRAEAMKGSLSSPTSLLRKCTRFPFFGALN